MTRHPSLLSCLVVATLRQLPCVAGGSVRGAHHAIQLDIPECCLAVAVEILKEVKVR